MRGCSGSGRTVIAGPREVAQGFADHLNWLLNQTVSDARLTLVPSPRDEQEFALAHVVNGLITPLELRGSRSLLFVEHRIAVVDARCATQSYSYRVHHGPERADWLVRWEYLRDPPSPHYEYPLGHVHLNAAWVGAEGESLTAKAPKKLHFATGRVPFELVLWQLIAEWGAQSREADWRKLFSDSIAGFEQRRSAS